MKSKYPEWDDRKIMIDLRNRFCACYGNSDGSIFYIEPGFYTTLMNFKNLFPEHFQHILDKMDELTYQNIVMVFTADDDDPMTNIDEHQNAKFATITDLANRIHVIIDDNSRGSDYGD